jgi:hypothetical protein
MAKIWICNTFNIDIKNFGRSFLVKYDLLNTFIKTVFSLHWVMPGNISVWYKYHFTQWNLAVLRYKNDVCIHVGAFWFVCKINGADYLSRYSFDITFLFSLKPFKLVLTFKTIQCWNFVVCACDWLRIVVQCILLMWCCKRVAFQVSRPSKW